MSYSHALRVPHVLGSLNFNADSTLNIQGPTGMRGRVEAVLVDATTSFTNVTTSARVDVGTAANAVQFASLDMVDTAAGTGKVAQPITDVYRVEGDFGTGLNGSEIQPGEVVQVNLVAPTGGTPAGVGRVTVIIDWF